MNNNDTYPTITLCQKNYEIEHCALFPAFTGLYAEFTMKDGTHFPYAEVIAYEYGAFVLAIGDDPVSYTVIAPVLSISNITYI